MHYSPQTRAVSIICNNIEQLVAYWLSKNLFFVVLRHFKIEIRYCRNTVILVSLFKELGKTYNSVVIKTKLTRIMNMKYFNKSSRK